MGISRGVGRKPEYLGKTQLVSRDETETGSLQRQRWQASVLIFTLPGTPLCDHETSNPDYTDFPPQRGEVG